MKRQDWETCNFVSHSLLGEGFDASEDGTGRGTPLVAVAFDTVATLDARTSAGGFPGSDGAAGGHVVPVAFSAKDYGADAGEIAPTLRAMGHRSSHANGGGQIAVAHAFDARQSDVIQYGDKTGPIDTDGHSIGVMQWCGGSAQDQVVEPGAVSPTLAHSSCARGGHNEPKVMQAMRVRRLTPRECERLQGFPDDYTAIPWRGKPADQCPDGPRYKALGNSWAVPCVRWIGQRIARELSRGRA